ncbi:MAG: SIMPL domain-containing protein [Patescibacteria group bacterium]|jgi:hypothetical protein
MKPFIYIVGGLLGVALIILVIAQTRNAFQQYNYIGKTGRDTISIEGTGKVVAKPDVAKITLGVTTDGASVKDIQDQNSKKMNAIIAAVKDLGVKADDIQTQQYSVSPRYDWANGKQTLLGYTITQQVEIKVREVDKAGTVLAKAGELGANQMGDMQFVIDDPSALEAQARGKAIEDAKTKAEALASQLGMTVVRVVSFSESSNASYPPIAFGARDMAMKSEAVAAPQIEVGTNDVIKNVSVVFEVR